MGEDRLVIQARVLFALLLREMTTRFGRSVGGYAWALIEPAGTVVLLTFVFSQVVHTPPLGSSFAIFYATGYLGFHIYMDISRNVSLSVKVNRALLAFPRVTMLDTILARFILQMLTAVTVFTLIISGFIIFIDPPVQIDLTYIFIAIAYAALLGVGVGTFNCAMFAIFPTWERVFNIINRPLLLISGVFFIYEQMPRTAQEILWWNPLLHITAIMRQGFYSYYAPSFVSHTYLMTLGVSTLMIGVLMLRVMRRRLLEE